MIRRIGLFFLALTLVNGLKAQVINPGEDEIFRESEIAIIRLVMSPEDKAFLLNEDNVESDLYLPATFSFTNSMVDTTLEFNAGIRLRGNTSRYHPKKSFKIKFKEFGGEKFYDLKKFNLKAENNDASMVREFLSLRTMRNLKVPAARTHHAEVYINDEYMGLYLNVEQIDDEFVQSRFEFDAGNIYKCSWGATLEDNGQIYDNGIYELETNKDLDDRSQLANFVKVLNSTPSSSFIAEIEKVFDVDSYIRYLAVEAIIGHWDGYSYNQNNFYLYENNETGLVEFIPYDMDNTFGMDWVDRDWGTRDVKDWPKHGEARPLTKKILAQTAYFERYERYLDVLLKNYFSEEILDPVFNFYRSFLADAVFRDTYYPLTFGFTYDSFEKSYTEQVASHAPYGLKEYVTTRSITARDQIGVILSLEDQNLANYTVYPNPVTEDLIVIEGDIPSSSISLMNLMGQQEQFDVSKFYSDKLILQFSLSPGVYVLVIGNSAQKITVR
jgi:spore coat protein H